MQTAADRLATVRNRIAVAERAASRPAGSTTLITVSKTFTAQDVASLIAVGQRHFGENRVQEAKIKFPGLKTATPDLTLHLIGPLQTNKVREAVALFDVIHTLDRDRIAESIAEEIERFGRVPKLLVQVNTGEEDQKAGVAPGEAAAFVQRCVEEFKLTISGLMCIPPVDQAPAPHFALLRKIGEECGLPWLSMGMSSDYATAINHGATHVRIGSAIFGARPNSAA